MKFQLATLCILLATSLTAQEKFEKEERIKKKEVPEIALRFVSELTPTKKIKWYAETSNDGSRIEAKFKLNRHLHSVEFETNGELVDVEVEIEVDQIPSETAIKWSEQFSVRFEKHAIDRIQIQYSGSIEAVKTATIALAKVNASNLIVQYELTVRGKTEEAYGLFEFTTDEKGSIIQELRVLVPESNNLEF